MAKKEDKSRKHETGKEETHSRKHDELKAQDRSKAGGQGKMKPYETDLENVSGDGKGKMKPYGTDLENFNGVGKGNKFEKGFENENKLDDGIKVPIGIGNPDGFGFSNPDLSAELGKKAAGKGCLTTVIGTILLIALLIIL